MWLRLTDPNDRTIMINSDHVIWFLDRPGGQFTDLHVTYYGGDRNITITVKETTEDIAALLTAGATL